jgi:hypothetical protein
MFKFIQNEFGVKTLIGSVQYISVKKIEIKNLLPCLLL